LGAAHKGANDDFAPNLENAGIGSASWSLLGIVAGTDLVSFFTELMTALENLNGALTAIVQV